mmetsp:Transcript_56030/g.159099  ORF Transcript_56030/g.159099 Transcript_56030/m.159099 type:complete len:128 (-) Transcript_56030:104-487(-)
MDELQNEVWQLEAWRECCGRGAQRLQDGLRQTESRLSDVAAMKASDLRGAEEEEREITRQHGETVAKLQQQLDSEVAHFDAALGRSLCGLSAELSADGGAALLEHAELKASAERLAERAKAHLGEGS